LDSRTIPPPAEGLGAEMASPLTALACHRSSAHVPTENRVAVCSRRLPAAVAGEQRGRPSPAWRRHTRRCDYLAISAVRPVTWITRHRQVVDALREGARLQTPGYAEARQSGLTAHLVAPDPATSPLWGAGSVRLTLAFDAEQVTGPGHVPCRTGSGSTGAGPGHEAIREQRSGSRFAVSSRAGLSAGRRRRRRDAEMLLVVRRAEQGRGLLGGGADVRSRA
jgi:hypothetical protein